MKNKFKKQRLKLAQRQAKENPAFEDKDKDPKELLKKRKRFDLEGPLKGFVICQSGIDFPVAVNRKEIEKKIVELGGLIEQNPKRCTHLLLLPDGADSKRHKTAVENGAQVLSLQQLMTAMKGKTVKEFEEEAPLKKKRTNAGVAMSADDAPDPFANPFASRQVFGDALATPFMYKPEEAMFRI